MALLVACGTLCFVQYAPVHASSSESPQGRYLGRDGELSLAVTLREDGRFRVEWVSKKTVEGLLRGQWKVEGERVVLKAEQAGGSNASPQLSHLKELKEFRLVPGEHHFMLVPDWNYGRLQQTGLTSDIACYWQTNAPAPQPPKQ